MARRRNYKTRDDNRKSSVQKKDTSKQGAGSSGSADTSNHSNSDSKETSGSRDGEGTEANASKKTSINDPTWYTKFPELAYGAGNLAFSELLGSPVKFSDMDFNFTNFVNQKFILHDRAKNDAIPGICSIVTKPSYGFNTNMNDPLNVAATQYYANVRYVNSGRKNYDQSDLMIATMAIADLFAFINWAQRVYGYAYMYSMRNKYINEALIEANHVNTRDLVEHLANFRYWLNTFISRVSALAVPSSINIFQRRAFMYAHLYSESTTGNIKDQLYQFVPDGFYKFKLDDTGKGMLKYVRLNEFANTQWTMNNFYAFGEQLLEFISGDEDFGLITGDIIKAYGSNIISMSPVPEALIIPPEYEEYTLSQMKNAHIASTIKCGAAAASVHVEGINDETFSTGDVMQANNGNLITVEAIDNTKVNPNSIYSLMPGVVTVTNPTPGVDDVLEATRLTTCAWPSASDKIADTDNLTVLATGSDIAIKWIMSVYGWDEGEYKLIQYSVENQFEADSIDSSSKSWLSEHFHWAPLNFLYTWNQSDDPDVDYSMDNLRVMGNVDNYTSLSWRNVANLHEVALISLLSVPGVATLVG